MAGVKKVTVNDLAAGLIIGTAVIFDGTKVVLFLVDAVPLVGTPIAVIGSYADSVLEFFCVFTPLYFMGAYKGKNSMSMTVLTMGTAMTDFTPFINDLPSTTFAVTFIIIRTRINDTAEHQKNAAKYAHQEKQKAEQQEKERRAQIAIQNADAGRQQAMAISLAANDNQRLSEVA